METKLLYFCCVVSGAVERRNIELFRISLLYFANQTQPYISTILLFLIICSKYEAGGDGNSLEYCWYLTTTRGHASLGIQVYLYSKISTVKYRHLTSAPVYFQLI
jgi:hypothetical protein